MKIGTYKFDNKKLKSDKLEMNCRDDVQTNNRQSNNHVKSCQLGSSNCRSKNNNRIILVITVIIKKKHETKRTSQEKQKRKACIDTWR